MFKKQALKISGGIIIFFIRLNFFNEKFGASSTIVF
jgi:hypothetical protein